MRTPPPLCHTVTARFRKPQSQQLKHAKHHRPPDPLNQTNLRLSQSSNHKCAESLPEPSPALRPVKPLQTPSITPQNSTTTINGFASPESPLSHKNTGFGEMNNNLVGGCNIETISSQTNITENPSDRIGSHSKWSNPEKIQLYSLPDTPGHEALRNSSRNVLNRVHHPASTVISEVYDWISPSTSGRAPISA
jgi:hypothetical protein